ncbi:T9SS type B sorting domain-containing protein [uncultured Kordia sp.]|uniref:T9SS type B sorting domain-containing protein n=1 Tax=uncultured Kordia sp. TaxID=507699 RepID=UPI002601EEE3|nr:T9SS type B sorting domain-containing protein [uncultured Kordia sp.]
MKKIYILLSFLLVFNTSVFGQITLSHNIGDELINTGMFSCSDTEYFGRTFYLADFGISATDEFVISSGNFGIARSYNGALASFNIYGIDDNFPDSFNETTLLGSSQLQTIPYVVSSGPPALITIIFDQPVIIPPGTNRILVEVKKVDNPNEIATPSAFFAGTATDNDISWYHGCGGGFNGINTYLPSGDLTIPKPNARFYITVNGIISTRILYDNTCLGDVTTFQLNSNESFSATSWDFGDGTTSTLESPTHTYTMPGTYNVSVTVTSGSNISTDTVQVIINDVPTVAPIVELRQCDDNLDGFSVFNLTEANSEISTNYLNETITFHESQTEAEANANPITVSTTYSNQISSTDSVWARIENANGCYKTSQLNLIVSTTQIPNTFTRNFHECDDAINGTTTDGITAFDFTVVSSEIQTLFPSGQQLIITYYRNQADALTELNPITDISNYRNIGYPTTQNIYIRVDSALNNDCLGLGHHITLHVETIPTANTVVIPEQCDADGDNMFEFDTSTIETTLLNGQTNVNVTYFDGNGNPLPSPLPNPFMSASQTITARVTNNTSLDIDGACYDETAIVFTVNAAAVANFVTPLSSCDDDSDGLATFNTSTIEALVLNGQTGMNVTYTDENGNTLMSPLPNPFTTASQTITVKVENLLNTICFDETTIDFIVYETPTAFPVADDIVCDDVSNDGEAIFIFSNYTSQVLNGQSNSDFEVFYFENMTDAENNNNSLPTNYTLNAGAKTIYARIQNRNNTDCYNTTSFQIGIAFFPIATQPDDLFLCDEEENDGIVFVDLSSQNITILNGQSASENTITYHSSQSDAESGMNNLNSLFENTANPQIIYTRLENNDHPECYTITSFAVNVVPKPVLTMSDVWSICKDESLEIIADPGFDEYIWSTGDTTQIITIHQAGTYELTVANTQGGIRCESFKTITVLESTIATIVEIEKTDWTQNNNTITVLVEGSGDYEYSIDGINYQDENIFSNLLIDDYLVHVRDKNGCGIVTEEVYLLYYPNFFTPNSDGYNDTWQLLNSSKEPLNRIYIFDRYGKLIKILKPDNIGWNGTYKGNPMPSADYWFLVERQNGKQYRGNFSLKR